MVLSEIAWTLLSYYKFSKPEVVKALRGIVNLRGLSIIDKFQFSKNWIIVSYDHDFDKIDIKRMEPGQI